VYVHVHLFLHLSLSSDEEEGEAPPFASTSCASTSHSTGYNHTAITEELEDDTVRTYHVTIPGTFVEVEMPGNAPLFKEGFVMRKNIMEGPHKKVPRGKRQWKPFYAHLKGFLLYFAPVCVGILLEISLLMVTGIIIT